MTDLYRRGDGLPRGVRVAVHEVSPRGSFERCDMAVIRADAVGGDLFVLVVDGAPGSAAGRPSMPRRRLFDAVRAVPVELPAADSLEALHANLLEGNRGSHALMFASAACMTLNCPEGRIDVAEVGDTKLWTWTDAAAKPVIAEGLPREDGRVLKGLGAPSSPDIRRREMGLEPGQDLAVLTDGAYHLVRLDGPPDEIPGGPGDMGGRFEDRQDLSDDCATLVLVRRDGPAS